MYIGVLLLILAACLYLSQLDWSSQPCATAVCVWSCFTASFTFATQEIIEQTVRHHIRRETLTNLLQIYLFL